MRFKMIVSLGLLTAFSSGWAIGALPQERPRKGLVLERPAQEPYVETAHGFMVPYEEEIPGTDIRFQMVPIPGGRFLIGSPESEEGRQEVEGPQVSVMIEPFWMGKHEVTWKEYRAFMNLHDAFKEFDDRGLRTMTDESELDAVTAPSTLYDPSFTYEGGNGPDTPAVTMTQYAAKQYTKWLSLLLSDFYRLPAEAEWEYACRAGTTTAYSFGDDLERLPEHAWYRANSFEQRQNVGQKLPNPWGLHDMHGNVAEWVLDAYTEEGYTALGDGMVAPLESIQWPKELYPRVARGGSWELSADDLRSASRLGSSDEWKDNDPCFPRSPWWHTSFPATGVGIRILRPLEAPTKADERERYWGANNEDIQGDVDYRIDQEGRGARGLVDPDLPAAMQSIENKQ